MEPVVSLTGQLYAFLMTVVAGVSMGMLFDFYRVLRAGFRPKRWLSMLCDLLYWVVVTPVVFFVLLLGNWGELRYYVLVGMLLGVFLHFQVFSSLLLWALVTLYHTVGSVFAGIGRLLGFLVLAPARLFGGVGGRGFLRGGARRSRRFPLGWRPWTLGRYFRP